MGTDFFDDDLLPSETAVPVEAEDQDPSAIRPVGEETLGRLGRQRQQMTVQVADAVKEVEILKQRQDKLEQEKAELAELTRKQDEYERGKREILEKLDRSIVLLGKEETQATRMSELLRETRERFKTSLAELRAIDEEGWADETFREDLNAALTQVEDARALYTKAVARIDASSWHKHAASASTGGLDPVAETGDGGRERGFLYWLVAGFAATLPLVLVIVALFAAYFFLIGRY